MNRPSTLAACLCTKQLRKGSWFDQRSRQGITHIPRHACFREFLKLQISENKPGDHLGGDLKKINVNDLKYKVLYQLFGSRTQPFVLCSPPVAESVWGLCHMPAPLCKRLSETRSASNAVFAQSTHSNSAALTLHIPTYWGLKHCKHQTPSRVGTQKMKKQSLIEFFE